MLKPINDYILIEKTGDEAQQTESGIFIAKVEHEMTEYHVGTVKAVSKTNNHYGSDLHVGDKVVYKHYRNITYKGYEAIKFEDIIIIDNDNGGKRKSK